MDWNLIATVGSALAAAVSFVLFALPMLKATEKKEHYRAVIEKKRRALYEQTRADAEKGNVVKKEEMTAAESIAAIYKIRKMAGRKVWIRSQPCKGS